MVVDTLRAARRYDMLHPSFSRAMDFLRSPEIPRLSEGRYELDGERLVALVIRKDGKTRRDAVLEAHRRDIDIHYVVEGRESIGWRPTGECARVKTPYDETSDCVFFDDEPTFWVDVVPGSFAIFLPSDAHATLVSDRPIHKVIVKVREEKAAG